jgi:hypothetical protein
MSDGKRQLQRGILDEYDGYAMLWVVFGNYEKNGGAVY